MKHSKLKESIEVWSRLTSYTPDVVIEFFLQFVRRILLPREIL